MILRESVCMRHNDKFNGGCGRIRDTGRDNTHGRKRESSSSAKVKPVDQFSDRGSLARDPLGFAAETRDTLDLLLKIITFSQSDSNSNYLHTSNKNPRSIIHFQ